jgi:hypothetical protein
MALYAYENGIPETLTTIKKEVKQLELEKPVLELPSTLSN